MAITENKYTGNGSTVLYSFTFPYLEVADIKVSLDGTLTTAYTLANATTVQFNTAPANGVAIRLFRQTNDDALNAQFFPGSAIRSTDLNNNFTQNLYVTQESNRDATQGITTADAATATANTALSNSSAAVSTANTASSNASAAVSTANTASSNASAAVSTANTASSNATTAVSTANAATATANSAASDAATAISTANSAVSTANTASTTATNAVNTANSASSAASSAVSTANTASSNASAAVSTANTASSNATSAVNTANSALSTANAAASAVANAILYDIVANVAAIPASPANNDAVEVTDSTGIESFTPLTSIPGGFAGNSGLSVRIVYTTTGNTWTWIQYFPNDPETRYLKEAVTTSDTAPVSPSDGDLWYDSVGGRTYVYYDDGDTSQWVDTSPQGSGVSDAISEGNTSAEVIDTGSDGRFVVTTEGSERLRITSAGLIGIGTNSPQANFHLANASSPVIYIQSESAATNSFGELKFGNGTGATSAFSSLKSYRLSNASASTALAFETTNSSGTKIEALRIDQLQRVGIGTTSPNERVTIASSTLASYIQICDSSTGTTSGDGFFIGSYNGEAEIRGKENSALKFSTNNTERLRITSAGLVGIGTSAPSSILELKSATPVLSINQTTANSAQGISFLNNGTEYGRILNNALTGILDIRNGLTSGAGYLIRFSTDGSPAMTIDSSQRVGIGTATANQKLHLYDASNNVYLRAAVGASTGVDYGAAVGGNGLINVRDNAALQILTNGTERARIDSSGRLLVGTSSSPGSGMGALSRLVVQGYIGDANDGAIISLQRGEAASSMTAGESIGRVSFNDNAGNAFAYVEAFADGSGGSGDYPGRLSFSTTADGASSPTERMRIGNNGTVTIGQTVATNTASGHYFLAGGAVGHFRDSQPALSIGRFTNDGTLVSFQQNTTEEGSISVSGTTVSYNGAHLSRWSQIAGIDPWNKAVRPEILRGTVMSNLDEMCDWTCPTSGDCQDNEQLNKTKISDVEGDKNVAGIFQAWDDDDDTWVNDYYLAMTGDFVIRIGAGTTVERGDLLMSAGDGTAKPQADDLVRSCTVAKVTSTTVSCTHPDGSYCVPCVLMAC
jgi:hypothetical protein